KALVVKARKSKIILRPGINFRYSTIRGYRDGGGDQVPRLAVFRLACDPGNYAVVIIRKRIFVLRGREFKPFGPGRRYSGLRKIRICNTRPIYRTGSRQRNKVIGVKGK